MQEKHTPSLAFAPGKHFLIDFYGARGLSDVDNISHVLEKAALACGATVLNINLHAFGPNAGVTGVALLAESHISIHTWPEDEYAAIDIFMCGDCDPEQAVEPLCTYFSPSKLSITRHQRGNPQQSAIQTVSTQGFANKQNTPDIQTSATGVDAIGHKFA